MQEQTSWLIEDWLDEDEPLDASQPATGIRQSLIRKNTCADRKRESELAALLTTTEIMIAEFHQLSCEAQRVGQALLDMLRHPLFDLSEIRSQTIVHLIRKFERPFAETAMVTYDLWQEGDGNQRLHLVLRDYLEVYRENAGSTMEKTF